MYKFRSMDADAEKLQDSLEQQNEANGPVFKIRNDPRVTPLGRLLRKWSIDELPQLWNVLCGDMSLVGPRPLPWRDVERITRPSDMRRFSMRPGLTCLWQVEGRCNIGFERWVELDMIHRRLAMKESVTGELRHCDSDLCIIRRHRQTRQRSCWC